MDCFWLVYQSCTNIKLTMSKLIPKLNHLYLIPNHLPSLSLPSSEFFERTILCNSLVWSCALTGKASLTYLEAVESERRARQSLQNFSPALLLPLLHLVAASRRCRLAELCEDIYGYVKDRFFPGETVDVTERSGVRYASSHEALVTGPSHKALISGP